MEPANKARMRRLRLASLKRSLKTMTPKFRSLGFWGITKMALLFQIIGLICALIASIIASALFPTWVKANFDMHQWNLPMTVLWFGGYVSAILFPFVVSGSWLTAWVLRGILGD